MFRPLRPAAYSAIIHTRTSRTPPAIRPPRKGSDSTTSQPRARISIRPGSRASEMSGAASVDSGAGGRDEGVRSESLSPGQDGEEQGQHGPELERARAEHRCPASSLDPRRRARGTEQTGAARDPRSQRAILPRVSAALFHPGHDEWHGQTVVVYTRGSRTVVGRWDAVEGGQLLMRDAAVHEDESTRDEWVARLREYGIPVQHRTYTLPHADVARVVRLREA